MTDYEHGDVPPTEAVEYFSKCASMQLGCDIAELIQRQGVTSIDIICATLTRLITFYLDTSEQTTEQIKAKALLLHYLTMIVLDANRAVRDAVKESEHATAH